MDLIILPGNSKEYNEKWLYDSKEAYKGLFDNTLIHTFKHWAGTDTLDIDFEVESLRQKVVDKKDYIILAKSIGVMVVLKAIYESKINPQKCIFVGSPFEEETRKYGDVEEWLKKFSLPVLFIQQTADMFFTFDKLKKFISDNNIKNYELIEIDGNNHAYDNYNQIKDWLNKFVFNK